MKQIIQDLKQGNTILEEVPAPQVKSGQVLIKTSRTLGFFGNRTNAGGIRESKFYCQSPAATR